MLENARQSARRGGVREARQRLPVVCLHPDPQATEEDDVFLADSARLRATIAAVDAIAARGERPLLFVDGLALQGRLANLLQRRYRLPPHPW